MLNFADRIMSDNAKTSCEFCWLPIILEEFNLEIFPPRNDPNKAPNGPPKEKPITQPNKLPQIEIFYFSIF